MKHIRTALMIGAGVGALGISLGFVTQQTSPGAATQAASKITIAAQTKASAEQYKVDTVHSSVVFRIEHLGVSTFYGTFNEIGGTYTFDHKNPENSRFDLAIKTNSVESRDAQRNRHLKSPDFFNVAEYPEITFKSTKVESASDKILRVTGNLTLHGVTKSITADLKLIGRRDTRIQGFKSGFDTMFTINRTDFGMDTYVAQGALGNEVTLFIGLEGARVE